MNDSDNNDDNDDNKEIRLRERKRKRNVQQQFESEVNNLTKTTRSYHKRFIAKAVALKKKINKERKKEKRIAELYIVCVCAKYIAHC